MREELIIIYFLLDLFMKNDEKKYLEIINEIKKIPFKNFIHYIQDIFDTNKVNLNDKFRENSKENYDNLIKNIKEEIEVYDINVDKKEYINFIFAKYLGRCLFYNKKSSSSEDYITPYLKNFFTNIKDGAYNSTLIKTYPKVFFYDKNKAELSILRLYILEEMNAVKIELNTNATASIDNKGNLILNKPARNEIEEGLSLVEDVSTDEIILETIKNLRNLLK